MKHKGFTLVEMMAVIAVLGLLVVLVLPNVLKSYRDAKKISFINEAKTVYKASTDKYVSEKTKGKKIGLIQKEEDGVVNELSLNEAGDLHYTIRLDSEGRVTSFKLSNGEFCIVGVGDFLGTYEKEDVIELSDEERAHECNVTSIQDNQKFILKLQNKETVKLDYSPKIIYLKYNVGWFNDNNLHNSIDSVTKPSKDNYYYEGAWATNTLGSSIQAISCDGTITQDKTGGGIFTGKEERPYVEAFSRFIKKYYQVSFSGGENSTGTIATLKCEYGSSECKLPSNLGDNGYGKDIKKTGYLFTGWKSGTNTYTDGQTLPVLTDENEDSYPYYKFDNDEVCNGTQNKENTLTFTAVWDPIKYQVKYNCNGGSGTMANTDHVYDAEKNLRKNTCSRTGYSFAGWSRTTDGNKEFNDEESVKNLTTVNNDVVTIYAKWTSNKYTITFNANGGDAWSSTTCSSPSKLSGTTCTKEITYDGEYGTLPTPERTGYTFKGWYKESSFTNKVESTTKVSTTSNHTLYAKWEANTYAITFNVNSGKAWNSTTCASPYSLSGTTCKKTVLYDGTYGSMPTPTKTGNTFGGWYKESSFTNKVESSTKVSTASNHTLYAKWTSNKYTITFDVNGGKAWNSTTCTSPSTLSGTTCKKTVTYNGDFGTLPTPTKTDSTFSGWYMGTTKITSTSIVSITANTTLVAKWESAHPSMQTWDGCGSLAIGNTITLSDNRDGNSYTIAKLNDGLCWMTQNLRLNLKNATITSDNTNNPKSDFVSIASGASPKTTSNWPSESSAINSVTYLISENTGYYTWYTATAGYGSTIPDYGSNYSVTANVPGDLCPKGWHLPRKGLNMYGSGENDELENFYAAVTLDTGVPSSTSHDILISSPLNFTNSGFMRENGLYKDSKYGFYLWSASETSQAGHSNAAALGYQKTTDFDALGNRTMAKNYGLAVRCIKDYAKEDIKYTLVFDANGGTPGKYNKYGKTTPVHRYDFIFNANQPDIKPTRSGYTFEGWADSPTATTPDYDAPRSKVALYSDSPIKRIYAVWKSEEPTMQGWDRCQQLAVGEIETLTDIRDGSKYRVSKLDDGNCWMIDNLRLDFSKIKIPIDDDNTNTHLNHFLEKANRKTPPTNGVWPNINENNHTFSDIDKLYYSTVNIGKPNYDSYGVYYDAYIANGGNALTWGANHLDVCPAGWFLPSQDDTIAYVNAVAPHGSTGDLYVYSSRVSFDRFFNSPSYFLKSGYYHKGVAVDRGTMGRYWLSYAGNTYFNMLFEITDSRAGRNYGEYYKDEYVNKHYGFTIRCMRYSVDSRTYTLRFDANGGTGTVPRTKSVNLTKYSYTMNITSETPTRTGYDFYAWSSNPNMSPGGLENQYTWPNSSFWFNGKARDVTLYAVWDPHKHVVTYDANGGTFSAADTTRTSFKMEATFGEDMPRLFYTPSRSGYTFAGLYYNDTQYYNDKKESVRKWDIDAAATLKAKWIKN